MESTPIGASDYDMLQGLLGAHYIVRYLCFVALRCIVVCVCVCLSVCLRLYGISQLVVGCWICLLSGRRLKHVT